MSQKDTSGMVRYSPEYKFKEGIFVNFEQVKLNKPVSVARIVSDYNPDELDFFENLTKEEKIFFLDDNGMKQEESTKTIWGYSRNGNLYINWNGEFNRIPVVGSISHFIADKTVYYERTPDPYYGYYNGSVFPTTYSSNEMRQYILDFETGKVLEFSHDNLETILIRDNVLYEEYSQLKKRKRRQLAFLYMRRFNDNQPLYLPEK
ncbi:MAG: hypothetical protein A2W91_17130 [Bacteroidetes bacterium GWF2_38_335]|nr:MAG: hypothetical protein A2W91_17130 [Bacteroidetes bacterium GWF2_38_335]OFY81408.1 MAG: hypothetical protein A2281_08105 [Bacteroidetes bacterium RIFOXYA12_FULL_38_20]HBS85533.1 hypothetical protein [Bacteroidales bacterium]